MFTNQTNNSVTGDLVAGGKTENNTYNIHPLPVHVSELSLLYEKLKADGIGELSGDRFCEKLQHYLAARTDGDVRGLESKLKDSGRLDQLETATELKESAAKAIMRRQMSLTAQRVFTIVLDELHTNFMLTVTPVVQEGASRREVDQCIQQVLQGTKSMLGENVLEITSKDLLALLYFLGGNCHIRWDKC